MMIVTNIPPAAQDKTSSRSQDSQQVEGAPAAERPSEKIYPIEKKPVIAYTLIRRGGDIYTRPCIFEGSPTHILQHETVLGIVPALPGVYVVEYLSEAHVDKYDEDEPIELGYEWPNQGEVPDWQERAREIEQCRLSYSRLTPVQKAEILKAAE